MNKLLKLAVIGICLLNVAWRSESGGGVVSDTGNIVRASIEATEVLQSNALARLYVETRLGGAVNYASFDSGGVLSYLNVTSSSDVVDLNNNDKLRWRKADGTMLRVGVSDNDVFVTESSIDVLNVSAEKILVTSVDSSEYKVNGLLGVASVYTVNTGGSGDPDGCQLTFTSGLLTSSTC